MVLDNTFGEKATWVGIVGIQVISGVVAVVFAWYGKDPAVVFTISTSISAGLGLHLKAVNKQSEEQIK